MRWTSGRRPAKAVHRFFAKELLPAAERLRAAGKSFFPPGPEAGADTYFRRRTRTVMSAEDFIVPGTDSVDRFPAALAAHWRSTGHPELCDLVPTLATLAKSLYAVGGPEPDQDLSPFIYVMF